MVFFLLVGKTFCKTILLTRIKYPKTMRIIITRRPSNRKEYNNMTIGSIHTVLDYSEKPLGFICQGFFAAVIIPPSCCEIIDGGTFNHSNDIIPNSAQKSTYEDIPREESAAMKMAFKYAIIITVILLLILGIANYAS